MGPQSASAAPGPVTSPPAFERTVTDANLVLGYLNPVSIAGGAIEVRPEPARAALQAEIARPLGLELAEAAYGVHLLVDSEYDSVRSVAVSTQRGSARARFRDRRLRRQRSRACRPCSLATWGSEPLSSRRVRGHLSAFASCWRTQTVEFQRARTLYAEVGTMGQLEPTIDEVLYSAWRRRSPG